ncbi:MAG: hypothetical protein WBI07_17140 [Mobilitalea sp.]
MLEEQDARLQAFEQMLSAVLKEYNDILVKMNRLKQEGKTNSITYKQLFGRKFLYIDMINRYQLYDLVNKEK